MDTGISTEADSSQEVRTSLEVGITDPTDPYDVVRFLIATGELDRSHSVLEQSEEFHESASSIRSKVRSPIEAEAQSAIEQGDTGEILVRSTAPTWAVVSTGLGPELTNEEADELIPQLSNGRWIWDGKRLGFNQQNDSSYYSLSKPLVTRNGRLILMTIEDLCPFLCGQGWDLMIEKDSSGWQVTRLASWIY